MSFIISELLSCKCAASLSFCKAAGDIIKTMATAIKLEKSRQEVQETIWKGFDEIKTFNTKKVLAAFKKAGIQNMHYTWVTGYGYDDLGKDKLDEVYANIFNTESALVRPQLVSGTHAITAAVWGNLNAGDELVCLGKPYDTLVTAFNKLSQKFHCNINVQDEVNPDFIDSLSDLDLRELITKAISPITKIVFIQRSRGYEWRSSYKLKTLERLIRTVKSINEDLTIFVDNCYGEFTQKFEPTDLGADLIAGSLIKNPGGGIVTAGAYIAGKKDLVHNAAEYMTAPGIGPHGGCMFDQTRLMLQGVFIAPLIVSEALKGMSLAAKLFEEKGFETIPAFDEERNDVIQAVKFNDKDKLIKFCDVVQKNSPVNSMFSPVPDDISGYDDQIIMASGSFIEGSSIELSCDGPLREPFVGYIQGGMSWAHTEIVLNEIVKSL